MTGLKQALEFQLSMKKEALLRAKLENHQLDIKRLERDIKYIIKKLEE